MQYSHVIQRIREVRDLASRWMIVRAVANALSVCLAVVAVFSSVDFLIRDPDVGLRWMLTIGTTAIIAFVVRRTIGTTFFTQFDDVETARWIERAEPGLSDRLSTMTAILQSKETSRGHADQAVSVSERPDVKPFSAGDDHHDDNDDALTNSQQTSHFTGIERELLEEIAGQIEHMNLKSSVDMRPAVRSLAISSGFVVFLILLAFLAPRHSATGVLRLVSPWKSRPWPTENELVFENLPSVVAKGSDLEVIVVDERSTLPSRIELQVRTGVAGIQRFRMRRSGNHMSIRLPGITSSCELRPIGGDDLYNTWQRVEVVAAPQVDKLTVTATPPSYTELPAIKIRDHVRLFPRSKISIEGTATHPVGDAFVRFVDENGKATISRMRLTNDRNFQADSLLVTQSGECTILARDANATASGPIKTFRIELKTDLPPSVSLVDADQPVFATPIGRPTIPVFISDDLRIRKAAVIVSVDENEEFRFDNFASETASQLPGMGKRHELYHDVRLDLSKIDGLVPGDVLTYRVEVTDSLSQVTESSRTQAFIVDEAELHSRLLQREREVFQGIATVREMQSQNLIATRAILSHDATSKGASVDELIAKLQSVQERVNYRFGDSNSSFSSSLDTIANALSDNQIRREGFASRVDASISALDRLSKTSVASAHATLSAIAKTIKLSPAKVNDTELPWGALDAYQQTTLDGLDQLLQRVDLWTGFEELIGELVVIADSQRDLAQVVEQAMLEMLDAGAVTFPTSNTAEQRAPADQQLELTWKTEQMSRALDSFAANRLSDPSARDTAQRVARRLRDGRVTQRMRSAAAEIDGQRLANAVSLQRQVVSTLTESLTELNPERDERRDEDLTASTSRLGYPNGSESTLPATLPESSISDSPKNPQADLKSPSETGNDDKSSDDFQNLIRAQNLINQETKAIHARLAKPDANKSLLKAQLQRLSREQGELAELFDSITIQSVE